MLFLYAKHYAAKGPNEVISCLDYYLQQLPAEVIRMHLFTDNAFSQNENRYLLSYLDHMAQSPFQHVEVH